jgi:hypothetical protein
MTSSGNLWVNKPLPGSTVHVLYAAGQIDTDTTISKMMEIGYAMFADPVMAWRYSQVVWAAHLRKQRQWWTES